MKTFMQQTISLHFRSCTKLHAQNKIQYDTTIPSSFYWC